MNKVPAARGQSGALLLSVALMLAVIAALAFGLNRAAGMDVQSVTADYDRRSVAYLAEGALAAARWYNEINANKCGKEDLPPFTLAGATLRATVNRGTSKRLNIGANATNAVTGASATLARNEVDIYDLTSSETKDLGGSPRDTYINYGVWLPVGTTSTLTLTSGQANALLYWPTNDIPANAVVLAARLSLTQNGNGGARFVNVHRLTAQWDGSATWYQSRAGFLSGVSWAADGGDYAAPALASTKVSGSGTYTWDVTGLVEGWVSGRLLNYGMLLRLQDPNQPQATFYSLEANNSNQRPALRVTFAKEC